MQKDIMQMEVENNSIQRISESLMELAITCSHELIQMQKNQSQSNYLVAKSMPWDLNCNSIDQYNRLYLNRMINLSKRIPLKNHRKIEELQGKMANINIIGMVKRLQTKRKRAFQKDYQQYYKNSAHIYSEKDQLELEDPSGKVKFRFGKSKIIVNEKQIREIDLPYGIVVGLNGNFSEKENKFIVSNIYLPQLPPQQPFKPINSSHKHKILILNDPNLETIKRTFQQLCMKQFSCLKNQIKSIIIVGYSEQFSPEDTRQVDRLYEHFSEYFDIFVMPGANQLQTPQRPYHSLLYKKSKTKICLCSSPQIFTNGPEQSTMSICVFDNLNLRDLKKNCAYSENDIELMEAIVSFSHFMPTAPFSVRCEIMPEDYFVINQLPHLMLATNSSECRVADFEKDGKKVRLVTMQKNKMMLIDQNTLEVAQFQINSLGMVDPENILDIEE